MALICRVGTRLAALPVEHVVETMRPLPLEAVAGAPPFVLGVSVIRGVPVPVVGAAQLLGATAPRAPTRFVTLRVPDRSVALAVDDVLGVRSLALAVLVDLPPLLGDRSAEVIASVGTLDHELLLVLRAARFLPEPGEDVRGSEVVA